MRLPFFKRRALVSSEHSEGTTPHVLVGLGNVGSQFQGTRHNLGIATLRSWVSALDPNTSWQTKEKFQAETATISLNGAKATALFPTTMMNNSGEAVQKYISYYNLQPTDILIIHEDIELPLGEVRFTKGGSAKGHNGVRSIHDVLRTTDIPRLRLGVSRPPDKMETRDYVLEKFSAEEIGVIENLISQAAEELTGLLK